MSPGVALLFPDALAGISVVGWLLAGVLWGVVWPLLAGTLAPHPCCPRRSSATP